MTTVSLMNEFSEGKQHVVGLHLVPKGTYRFTVTVDDPRELKFLSLGQTNAKSYFIQKFYPSRYDDRKYDPIGYDPVKYDATGYDVMVPNSGSVILRLPSQCYLNPRLYDGNGVVIEGPYHMTVTYESIRSSGNITSSWSWSHNQLTRYSAFGGQYHGYMTDWLHHELQKKKFLKITNLHVKFGTTSKEEHYPDTIHLITGGDGPKGGIRNIQMNLPVDERVNHVGTVAHKEFEHGFHVYGPGETVVDTITRDFGYEFVFTNGKGERLDVEEFYAEVEQWGELDPDVKTGWCC